MQLKSRFIGLWERARSIYPLLCPIGSWRLAGVPAHMYRYPTVHRYCHEQRVTSGHEGDKEKSELMGCANMRGSRPTLCCLSRLLTYHTYAITFLLLLPAGMCGRYSVKHSGAPPRACMTACMQLGNRLLQTPEVSRC